MAGMTSTGFVPKTYAEILASMEASLRAALGSDLDVSPEHPLGQILAIVAAGQRELWEAAAAAYDARDPSAATGDALTGLAALTGTVRRAARAGTVPLAVTLAAGATLPAGNLVGSNADLAAQWRTAAAVANPAAVQAAVAVGGEQVSTAPLADPLAAVDKIVTPVAGWIAVTSLGAATPSAPAETDPQLRRRRETELAGAGSSPAGALRARLSRLAAVTDVVVWENDTGHADADGRPSHSVEAMVLGGDDAAVALTVWQGKAGGIATHGGVVVPIVDDKGVPREVRFSRPAARPVWVVVEVDVPDGAADPGDAAIKAAVLAEFAGMKIGQGVRRAVIERAVLNVPGVDDVAALRIGTAASPTGTGNVAVGPRELAVCDATKIEVNRV